MKTTRTRREYISVLLLIAVAVTACSLLMLCPASTHAQGGVPLWTNQPGGTAIAVDSSGNAFVTGGSGTIKYSSSGTPLWTNLPGGLAIAVDSGGNVFVTGTFNVFTTRAYSNDGVPLWTNCDVGTAIAVDSNGNVFVTGSSVGSGTSLDYVTIKYSGTGVPLWTNRYDVAGENDYASAIAVDGSGNVFVTGQSLSGGELTADYATVAYSSAGDLLWINGYNGPVGSLDRAFSLAVDSSGNVFVTGFSATSTTSGDPLWPDYATVAYSSAGVPLWTNRYNGPGNRSDDGYGIAVDSGGNVFVTGVSSDNSGANSDYATIKYSSSGVPLWTRRYNGPANSADVATGIAVDRSGNVFVTGGSSAGNGYADIATVAYSTSGVPLWSNRYSGGSAYAIALDRSGNVFVTGDSVTIKYSSSVPPPRLDFQKLNNQLVLSWTNAGFNLQTAPAVTGPFTNLPAATSPYTNSLAAPQQFFRLISN